MRARPFLLAVLATAIVLAGCSGPKPTTMAARTVVEGPWSMHCYGGAADWTDPCTARATRQNGPSNENWLAVNPTDPENVVVMGKDYNPKASDCVWMGVEVTKDGGKTWTESYLGGDLSQRQPTDASYGYTCNTDPMFAFDSAGVLYASFEVYSRLPNHLPVVGQDPAMGGQNTMFIAISKDGGLHFGPFVSVWSGDGLMVLQDRTMIVTSPTTGTVFFAWSQRVGVGTVGEVLVSESKDHGATWSVPTVVTSPSDNRLDIPVALAAAPDGTIYVGWYSLPLNDPAGPPVGETTTTIQLSASTDDGKTYSPPRNVQSPGIGFVEYAPHSRFYVAVDLQMAVTPKGDLYMVWNDNATGHLEVMVSHSADKGQTWTPPVAVAGPDADDHARFHGAVAADMWGRVHVTYFDRQYDPNDKLLDITWASSDDGTNFTQQRVTASSFDGDLGFHQSGVPFIGDYNGIGVVGGHLYASFPDTRAGRSDLAVAHFART